MFADAQVDMPARQILDPLLPEMIAVFCFRGITTLECTAVNVTGAHSVLQRRIPDPTRSQGRCRRVWSQFPTAVLIRHRHRDCFIAEQDIGIAVEWLAHGPANELCTEASAIDEQVCRNSVSTHQGDVVDIAIVP